MSTLIDEKDKGMMETLKFADWQIKTINVMKLMFADDISVLVNTEDNLKQLQAKVIKK